MALTQVELSWDNQTSQQLKQNTVEQTFSRMLQRLGMVDKVKIEVLIVGDKDIQALNRQHLGHDCPTDVLSFPASDQVSSKLLGSIVISTDTAEVQARQAGISLQKEASVLAGHGLLHLLGFHHA